MDKCVNDASNNQARLGRDRQDWQNLLFERGGPENQYIIWDNGTNRYVTRGDDPKKGGLPPWMPRPVSNLFANQIDGIISVLNQSKPAQTWKPQTEDDDDLATAEVCEHALPALYDEIGYDRLRPEINRSVALTDKVALALYYDNHPKWGTKPILAMSCPACGEFFMPEDLEALAGETEAPPSETDPALGETGPALDDATGAEDEMDPAAPPAPEMDPDATPCPSCGQAALQDAVTPQGVPIGMDYPIGRMCAQMLPSFEFSLPQSARTHRDDENPWILSHSRMSWEATYAEFPQHRDKLKETAGTAKKGGLQRGFADALRRLSSPRAASEQASGGGDADGPVLYRVWHDPIDTEDAYFPEGLYAIMVDGLLLEAGPLPFCETTKDGQKRYFKNVLIRTFRATPSSQFGKPPADDLVPLQYNRNLLEALLMAILLHNAAPRTYLPLSVTLDKPITGVPGEIVTYRSVTPGEVPQTANGINPPEGLYKWIEQIDNMFAKLSKLNAVLQGERPAGDPTLGEIQILKERGESAFAEPLLELVRFERQLSRMLLWIARDTVWVERLRQIKGENGAWEVKQFTNADLQGAVDVTIDEATAWPTSPLMQKLQLKEGMEMQLFALFQADPELAGKIAEKMGLSEFKPSFDVDRKQVMRELDRWRAAHGPQDITPPDPVLQNLPFHLMHKLAFLKTEESEQLAQENPPLFAAMKAHVQAIQQQLAMQQMQAAMAQAGPPAPGKGEPPKPDGSALDHAIKSGVLKPAGAAQAGAPGSPLDSMVAAGVLTPAGSAQAGMPQPPAGPSIDDLVQAGVMTPKSAADARGAGSPGA